MAQKVFDQILEALRTGASDLGGRTGETVSQVSDSVNRILDEAGSEGAKIRRTLVRNWTSLERPRRSRTIPVLLGILALGAGFVVLEGLFVLSERAPGAHFIEPTLFRSRIFAFGTAAATLQSLSMFAVNFLLVFYLQGVKGVSPFQAALMILPLSLVQSVVGPIGGTLSDRTGLAFRLPRACCFRQPPACSLPSLPRTRRTRCSSPGCSCWVWVAASSGRPTRVP